MLKKNSIYKAEVIDMASTGSGVCKIDNMTVFVDGGLTGDVLNVKIDVLKKKYATGRITKLITPSLFRTERKCSEKLRLCGGCQIQELDYKKQLEIKENEVLQAVSRIGGVDYIGVEPIIGMENPFFYRNKAQYPVQVVDGELKIGFYKRKSHDVIDTNLCVIQDKRNEEIIKIIREFIISENISVYDEKSGKGLLRHIIVRTGFKTGEIMVVLVVNSAKPDSRVFLPLSEILEDRIEGFKTLVLNKNTRKTNVIMGYENEVISGSGKIYDYIDNIKFEISPLSFFQVNPVQTEVLYSKALEFADLSGDERVFDIYCGLGSISLFLAQKAKSVIGIEVIEQAVEDARKNAALNSIENASFYAGKAEDVVPALYDEGKTADVVVVDPPRKGCDEKVLETIDRMNPEKLVYVSCNPSTLARDIKILGEKGFAVKKIQPVDLFPHSMHVESVVLLTKVQK